MKNYYIITFGCQMNKSDSERIAAILENLGYKSAPEINEADLIVVNMCSVRQSAVDRVYGRAKEFFKLKTKNKKLKTVLTGCITKKDFEKFKNFFDFILPINTLEKWQEIISKENNFFSPAIERNGNYLKISPKRKNKKIAYIPISTGCNNFCTYCVVPFTRGRLVCRNTKEILKEVKMAVKNNAKEIWLLGQNVNDYVSRLNKKRTTTNKKRIFVQNSISFDKNSGSTVNFAKLVKMVNDIPGSFKFFFTSPHPKNFSDKLIETLANCEKFGKVLNLPVQSGDNEILKRMNRNYTVEEYKNLVKKIREKIPDIKLSTDVIVGFPGETKKQFQNTVKLFKETKFNWAYIAKYSPRPGTAASLMKDSISLEEKKKREKILRELIAKNNAKRK